MGTIYVRVKDLPKVEAALGETEVNVHLLSNDVLLPEGFSNISGESFALVEKGDSNAELDSALSGLNLLSLDPVQMGQIRRQFGC